LLQEQVGEHAESEKNFELVYQLSFNSHGEAALKLAAIAESRGELDKACCGFGAELRIGAQSSGFASAAFKRAVKWP